MLEIRRPASISTIQAMTYIQRNLAITKSMGPNFFPLQASSFPHRCLNFGSSELQILGTVKVFR